MSEKHREFVPPEGHIQNYLEKPFLKINYAYTSKKGIILLLSNIYY